MFVQQGVCALPSRAVGGSSIDRFGFHTIAAVTHTMLEMVAGNISLDEQQIPHSSLLARTVQQVGGSFGTAVLAMNLESANAAYSGTPVNAFRVAFGWSAGSSAVAVLLSLRLPAAMLHRHPPSPQTPLRRPTSKTHQDTSAPVSTRRPRLGLIEPASNRPRRTVAVHRGPAPLVREDRRHPLHGADPR